VLPSVPVSARVCLAGGAVMEPVCGGWPAEGGVAGAEAGTEAGADAEAEEAGALWDAWAEAEGGGDDTGAEALPLGPLVDVVDEGVSEGVDEDASAVPEAGVTTPGLGEKPGTDSALATPVTSSPKPDSASAAPATRATRGRMPLALLRCP